MISKNIFQGLVLTACIFLLAFSLSCSREFDYTTKMPSVESRLCLTGIVTPDSIFVNLTRNLPRNFQFSGKDPFQIQDTSAIIHVYENGEFFCKLTPQSKIINKGFSNEYVVFYYISYKKTTEGKTYTLSATHKDYESLSAETVLPYKVSAISIDTVNYYKNERYYRMVEVKQDSGFIVYHESIDTTIQYTRYTIIFQDPPAANYYSVSASQILTNKAVIYPYTGFDDPIVENKLSRNEDKIIPVLFSDKFIQGKKYGFSFSLHASNYKTVISLRAVSSEYYKYGLSVWNNNATIGDKYREPVIIYSNVKGGYGILAAFNATDYELNNH